MNVLVYTVRTVSCNGQPPFSTCYHSQCELLQIFLVSPSCGRTPGTETHVRLSEEFYWFHMVH